jgi:hypothetical protein
MGVSFLIAPAARAPAVACTTQVSDRLDVRIGGHDRTFTLRVRGHDEQREISRMGSLGSSGNEVVTTRFGRLGRASTGSTEQPPNDLFRTVVSFHVTDGRAVSSQLSETGRTGIRERVMVLRVFVAGGTGVLARRLRYPWWRQGIKEGLA